MGAQGAELLCSVPMACPHAGCDEQEQYLTYGLPGAWMELDGVGLSQIQLLPHTSICQVNCSVNAGKSSVVVSPPSSLCPDCDLFLLFDLAFCILTLPFCCHLSLCSLRRWLWYLFSLSSVSLSFLPSFFLCCCRKWVGWTSSHTSLPLLTLSSSSYLLFEELYQMLI